MARLLIFHNSFTKNVGNLVMNMRRSEKIDEYALAAFICGKLPGSVRETILASLENEDEAHHLLVIVRAALDSSSGPDDAMRWVSENWKPAA